MSNRKMTSAKSDAIRQQRLPMPIAASVNGHAQAVVVIVDAAVQAGSPAGHSRQFTLVPPNRIKHSTEPIIRKVAPLRG